ncbi:MAG: diguanylate cyclase [Gloeomargaritaceae cyanobacterium C42_A2020_066]|nr:diguanylate cyclase [Gloeomargaritaceae cyanobacterium C42_A2020_066]
MVSPQPVTPAPLILIADDESPMRHLLRQTLEKDGYQLVEATNGAECLTLFRDLRPDMVLLDAVMPVLDGFSCCAQLRAAAGRREVPLLMITGLDDAESVEEAFQAGATDYITKPIHWAVLRQRVARLLMASRAMEELRQRSERERRLIQITARIRRSLDQQEILRTAVEEIQALLEAEQVAVCELEGGTPQFIVESSLQGWPTLGDVAGPYPWRELATLQPAPGDWTWICPDSQQTSDWYGLFLAQHQIHAGVAVPIIPNDRVWGLLCVHQYSAPRTWSAADVGILQQVTLQLAGGLQQAQIYAQLETANAELLRLVAVDGLTQVANRRRFDEYLHQEWRRAGRTEEALSLILADIDWFKHYNDTYGHIAGDDCLRRVAQAIQRAVKRPADLVARYGGEEFAVILPQTGLVGAMTVAEQIRQAIAALELPHAGAPQTTIVSLSLGVASLHPAPGVQMADLVKRADQALYQAKQEGRNRVAVVC